MQAAFGSRGNPRIPEYRTSKRFSGAVVLYPENEVFKGIFFFILKEI